MEGVYVAFHLLWAVFFGLRGVLMPAVLEMYAAGTVLAFMLFYGDDKVGKQSFVCIANLYMYVYTA